MDYKELVNVYLELEKTTKRLEKTKIVSNFLKKIPLEQLDFVIYLIEGRVFPLWDERKIGFSDRLMIKAISQATGTSSKNIENLYSKVGDLGKVSEQLVSKKTQSTLIRKKLTLEKVIANIRKLSELEGEGTVERKISLIAELLSSANPEESRFIVGTVLETLRIGIAEGIVRGAIADAFEKDVKDVESAFDILVDYGEVAKLAKQNKLGKIELSPGRPVKVMLAILVSNIEEGFEALGKPCQLEFKLDGFRLEIHKFSNKIKLFTRRMEDVTKQFPEVMDYVKNYVKGSNFILDAEAVGYDKKTGKYLPFQNISQRIKRKYNIEELAKRFPMELNIFDVIYYNGKILIDKPLKERRKILENIIKPVKGKIIPTETLVTDDLKKAESFYKRSLEEGNEGIMLKNINSIYKAGRYVNGWCKLKPTLEPLDLVITGAEFGKGKRAGFLSSYAVSCFDKQKSKFLECGMVSTGIKEKESETGVTLNEITKLLKPLIISQEGRKVIIKPEIVVEVGYEEIQKSPTYSSGFALRFPRFKRLRIKEKTARDANTIADIERIYNAQKHRGK